MNDAAIETGLPAPGDLDDGPPVPLPRGVRPSAIGTVLRITADRQVRGRKLLVLCAMFSLPILFAALAHRFQDPFNAKKAEDVLVFGMIPQALVPLAALLFASGMVQDDVEEQTLTYLMIRPVPRWLIYASKLAGTWLVLALVTAAFTTMALAAVYWGTGLLDAPALAIRAGILSGILALALAAYAALFGLLGLLTRRALVGGVAYIVAFEGAFANIDFAVRWSTVMFHVRTLSIRWLGLSGDDWGIDAAKAPAATTSVLVLAGVAAAAAVLGALAFSTREFRVKTPEGS
ncbi:ABC-2 family transporter protein [Aquisphaera giovannonii]|uniref:ABC-2 family transporter protein n=1 Tax=Aquisphaera giovannonii TaxID=406548 RepID=A0A5B9W4B1_9BACT|nr:ABC transporter permease subunit [Aquisphaera giovannonii]QEH34945.1 ABC-2 family transporter protein [Aquisphaera giovannonii]